jgi:Spy/CpxP family protein refolding chaperone
MRISKTLIFIMGLALTVTATVARAQDAQAPPPPAADALLDARVGTWQGTGTMMGMAMTETATIDWALGHRFLRPAQRCKRRCPMASR